MSDNTKSESSNSSSGDAYFQNLLALYRMGQQGYSPQSYYSLGSMLGGGNLYQMDSVDAVREAFKNFKMPEYDYEKNTVPVFDVIRWLNSQRAKDARVNQWAQNYQSPSDYINSLAALVPRQKPFYYSSNSGD